MSPTVLTIFIHDLRGGLQGFQRGIVTSRFQCAIHSADLCGSFIAAIFQANLCGFLHPPLPPSVCWPFGIKVCGLIVLVLVSTEFFQCHRAG